MLGLSANLNYYLFNGNVDLRKGCSAYHPRMMLQILVYAYLRNIYSSRRIEEFCRNDIPQ